MVLMKATGLRNIIFAKLAIDTEQINNTPKLERNLFSEVFHTSFAHLSLAQTNSETGPKKLHIWVSGEFVSARRAIK